MATPLGLRLGADIDDDGCGHAVAQVHAHDDGVDGLEGEQPRGGEKACRIPMVAEELWSMNATPAPVM